MGLLLAIAASARVHTVMFVYICVVQFSWLCNSRILAKHRLLHSRLTIIRELSTRVFSNCLKSVFFVFLVRCLVVFRRTRLMVSNEDIVFM